MAAEVEFHTLGGREIVALQGDRCTVGRGSDNDIHNPGDPTLSAVHAVFEWLGGSWCVRDLDSSNGTFVNGERVLGGRPLRDGDELRLGATRMVFRTDEPRAVSETTRTSPPPELTEEERTVLVELCRPKLLGSMLDPPPPVSEVAQCSGQTEDAVRSTLDRLAERLDIGDRTPARLAFEAVQRGLVGTRDLHQRGRPSFVREEDRWRIAYGGVTFVLPDLKGLGHLHVLLSTPGREVFVVELAAAVDGSDVEAGDDRAVSAVVTGELRAVPGEEGIPMIDEQAKAAYRDRVEELREQVREGEEFGDPERVARARTELDAIAQHLSEAVGLGGRDRTTSSQVERARVNVTRAIRTAIDKIRGFSPELAEHLDETVSTGRYCLYDPDDEVAWQL